MSTGRPVWAIVVAAGSGERFGAPKQYEQLGDRRVLDWSLDAARVAVDGIALVVRPDEVDRPEDVDVVVAGGATRSASVRAGLAAVPDDVAVIVVHDAARPAASGRLFAAVIGAIDDGIDGAVPGLAVIDTVKRVRDGVVVDTLDRTQLVAVQTPQAFRAAALRAAHAAGDDATDDGALVEAMGGRVMVVPGEPDNVKVTSRDDLDRLRSVLA